jgi:hypothetical protein
MCGETEAQKQDLKQTTDAYSTALTQASSIFGDSSSAFNDLMKTFGPTIAAGPSQYGFSNQEDQNLRSQAITNVGGAYKNEKQAVGEQEAAAGGGASMLPGGASIGTNLSLAENAGNQTANELSEITQAGYQQGNKNYNEAVAGEEAAPAVFGAATSATGAATSAGNLASNQTNQAAASAQSPWQLAAGVLGAGVGAASGVVTKQLLQS